MLSSRALALAGQLHDPPCRRTTARELAHELGAVELLVFTSDPEIGVLLPAPGFPQTLAPGRLWRAFLNACASDGSHHGVLTLEDRALPAFGIAAPDGSVLVLLGGQPREDLANELLLLVPLLASAFGREQAVIAAAGHAAVSRQAAESANRLANALDVARRDLQAALSRSEQAIWERDAFVSVAAHELNTPITVLKGLAQLQIRRLDRSPTVDTAALRQQFVRIDSQANKVARLIGQLLDVARLESGQLPLDPAPTDIVALLRDRIDAAGMLTQEHVISFNGPPSLVVDVDALRLEQVISNVIDNAIKYSPAGGSIEVDLLMADGLFSIVVTDEGLGVPDAEQDRIFERFQRVEGRSNLHGLGIGLFVSRQIVELHGGHIHAESRPGRPGTRFVISLPLWQGQV